MVKLTPKQQCFVEEYLIDLNATQAAIRAGYSSASAGEQGSALLKNPKVRAHVDELLAERSRRTGVTQDRVVRELARIAFVSPLDIINAEDATIKEDASDDDKAVIQSIRVKTIPSDYGDGVEREVKLADKQKALELLGRHLGMFNDRVNVTGTAPVVLEGNANVRD